MLSEARTGLSDAELLDAVRHRDGDIVFLGGSRAEGFDNERSDYDVYVVTEDHSSVTSAGGLLVAGAGERVRIDYRPVGSARLEVQYWLRGDVLASAAALSEHEARPLLEIWPRQLELLHRLRSASALHNPDAFEELVARVDFGDLERYLVRFHDRVYESYAVDVAGALDSDRVLDAALAVRLALDHALDAYLAVRHDTNPKPKWRFRRLGRVDGDGTLTAAYRRLLGPPPDDRRASLERYVHRCSAAAETVSSCVQLGVDYADVAPARASLECARRRPGVRLKRLDGGSLRLLGLDGAVWEVNETAGLIWAMAPGMAGAPAIAERLADHFGKPAADLEPGVRRTLDGFYAAGILGRSPADEERVCAG